jgi:hypothetical protein
MRLQVAATLVMGSALAGGEAGTRVDVYTDGDVTAVMPSTRVQWSGEHGEASARYAVDAVSGATPTVGVDLVSSATTFSDVRHDVALSVTARPRATWGVGASGGVGTESDYTARRAGIHGTAELFERMVVVSAAARASADDVSGGGFTERQTFYDVDLSWDHILGKTLRGSVLVSTGLAHCGERMGCMASPYRYVPVGLDARDVVVPERNPDQLAFGAVGVRVAKAVGSSSAIRGGYRVYRDSWRVTGHTLDATAATSVLDDRAMFDVHGRVSSQGAASFYRERYAAEQGWPSLPAYRTADRELSPLGSWSAGARSEWTVHGWGPFVRVAFAVRLDRISWTYRDLGLRRSAWVGGGGIDAEL